MKTLTKLALILFLIGLITSCTSARKCGNKKGIKTPMGTM
jgi:hypothetical protein